MRGLNQQFAKLPYGKLYRGFESPSLRKDKSNPPLKGGGFLFLAWPFKTCFEKDKLKTNIP